MSLSDIFLIVWAIVATFYAFHLHGLFEKSRVVVTAMLDDDKLYSKMKADWIEFKKARGAK